jgi:hypothetical protein
MRTSRDIVFDESRPFYPRATTDAPLASLVDHLSFLFFPDAPASLPLPRPTLPTSVSSAESCPIVPDYTVKPPVTQVYSRRGAHLSDAPTSSAELSSAVSFSLWMCHLLLLRPLRLVHLRSSFLDVVNAYVDHLTVTLLRLSLLLLFLSQLLITILFFIRNGSTRWLRTDTWDLVPCFPRVRPITS